MTDPDFRTEAALRPAGGRSMLSRIKLGHVVMVLAALFALVANLAVLRSNEASVTVAIAARDIRAGTTLTADHFATAEVPDDGLLSTRFVAASDVSLAVGRLATSPIAAGDPILESDLLEVDNRDGLRAMSIPIEQSRAVSGQLRPGDSVDVVLVLDGVATFIATSIEVLDVPDAETNALGARTGYSPTVAVDAIQALRIAAALDAGEVHLVRATGAAIPDVEQATAIADSPEGQSG